MRLALDAAGRAPKEVDHVNAHATSTVAGDRAEALALQRVFGDSGSPKIVSTKGMTGHGLSLSGILEAGLAVMSLKEQRLPGNCNLVAPDEACEGLELPVESSEATFSLALNNSSGFGGSNVCHVLACT